jgi:hypothetical protein
MIRSYVLIQVQVSETHLLIILKKYLIKSLISHLFEYFCLGPDRMLIFSSTEQLEILQSSTDFLMDGTFEVCKISFKN